jgi:exodeoxyribonuclease V beta subunit
MTEPLDQPDMPMPLPLNALQFPLWGSRLIEASAGTGKTWTIAALYVRLVLGHGSDATRFVRPLMPADILVMTFTRAATRELSERIRSRLLEAARCFRGEAQPRSDDSFLCDLLASYTDASMLKQDAWRLSMAAECMDEASVHTIDAWCQRMLRDHAFDSGSLFEEELVADEQALLTQAVQDYWRQQCYSLSPQDLSELLAIWPTVERLQADVKGLLGKVPDDAELSSASLADVLTRSKNEHLLQLQALQQTWREHVKVMHSFVLSQDPPKAHGWVGTQFSISRLTGWLNKLQAWAEGRDASVVPKLDMGWTRMTLAGLADMRQDGLASGVAACMSPDQTAVFEAFAKLPGTLQQLPGLASPVRRHAALRVAHRLRVLKRQQGTFGFSDLQERLDAALQGPHAESLRDRIAQQYPVALIDEFQDTAPIQYRIFDAIYQTANNSPAHAFLMIGDPKQSIYGFRGADIYSYLKARAATEGRHYALSVNYRSTQALVNAVNHGFVHAEGQQLGGAFQLKAESGHNPLPFVPVQAQGRTEKWVSSAGDMPAITLVHELDMLASGVSRKRFAERCAEQIATWLNDARNGFAQADGTLQRLRPQDIAVLVPTSKEALAVQRALQMRQITSVFLSDKDSVYQSDEARDLVHWLRAVAAPQDAALVRAGLALASVGLPLAELMRLATDDEAFDAQVEALRQLRQTWQSQGVLAMLRQTLHRFGLAARWLAQSGGERSLTHFLHLAELLQNASSDLEGEQALIRWLLNQIAENTPQSDDQVVRLESDADLVKIVTIHASKGLEYPVVCLPFATRFKGFDAKNQKYVYLPDAEGGRQLVLNISEAAKAQFEQERLREDLRLLYVAMTRARHALWLGFCAVKLGTGLSCKTHQSAIGVLLGGPAPREAADWLEPLQHWADSGQGIRLVQAPVATAVTALAARDPLPDLQAAPEFRAEFDRSWGIASYSRLTRDLKALPTQAMHSNGLSDAGTWAMQAQSMVEGPLALPALSPLHVMRPADDERPMGPGTTAITAASPIWHSFKRGPLTGNWLHQQLDWLSAEGFQLADNPPLMARLQARCERAHKDAAPALADWLLQVVQHPMPGLERDPNVDQGVALADLTSLRSEMEFWLPAHRIQTRQLDQLCQTQLMPGVPRPSLQSSTLHGMLMGFMDLVFEHRGRYWVLDYKSNALGNEDAAYSTERLQAAMAEHRYDVQAAIYALALHRLLRSRLGASYDPEQHLGGAAYLFLRGIHGPAGGMCTLNFSAEFLAELDHMLDPVETSTHSTHSPGTGPESRD